MSYFLFLPKFYTFATIHLHKYNMKALKLIIGTGLFLSVFSCGRLPENYEAANVVYEEEMIPISDKSDNSFISSSAAVETGKDSTRRFVRTADLRFKVKNVIQSTYDIEGITASHGGFVTYTDLNSEVNKVTNTVISADSVLETTHYTITNILTLRVPNTALDTVLKDISRNIDFLDYRSIRADDVALQILANKLTQKRIAKSEKRLTNAIDNQGNRLRETTSAEELLLNKQEQADKAVLANFSLEDRISFSTINIHIYQRPSIRREVITNEKNIDAYTPGIGIRLIDAAKTGWDILIMILIFIVDIWPLLLFGAIGYLAVRYYKKRV